MSKTPVMTSNRPYLIRAMHAWIDDNGMTPFLLVDAQSPGVDVPPSVIKDGKVVLNVAGRAVAFLELGNEDIRFQARFSGVSQHVVVPVAAVEAIYAKETGQGMMLPPDGGPTAPPSPDGGGASVAAPAAKPGPKLRVVK